METKREITILDLSNDYFLVKFALPEDIDTVISGGPWIVHGHYLIAKKWTPEFMPDMDTIDSTLAWIRFPNLSHINIPFSSSTVPFICHLNSLQERLTLLWLLTMLRLWILILLWTMRILILRIDILLPVLFSINFLMINFLSWNCRKVGNNTF